MLKSIKYFIIFSLSLLVVTPAFSQVDFDKKAKIVREKKRLENDRFAQIIDSRNLDDYNQYLKDYPKSKNSVEIRNRVAEINLWNNTTALNTIEAYQNYIKSSNYNWYATEANKKLNALLREKEKKAFDNVKSIGTVEAYEDYLNKNPNSGYTDEAKKAIYDLKSESEWKNISSSSDVNTLINFISKYPDSKYAFTANKRVGELRGAQAFAAGDYSSALSEYKKAGRDNLSAENQKAYDTCIEYEAYKSLDKYSLLSSLKDFINRYPTSQYTPAVKNYLACKEADNLTTFSYDTDYDRALSYATDATTRQYVENKIKKSKEAYRQHEKEIKYRERRENGGWLGIGWSPSDLTYVFDENRNDCLSYNMGLAFRLGNYRDRFRFTVGFYPGMYITNVDSEEDDPETFFHMPVKLQLDLRLFSNLYIFGGIKCNTFYNKDYEGSFGWRVGLGLAWQHTDVNIFYGKQNVAYNRWNTSSASSMGIRWTIYWRII